MEWSGDLFRAAITLPPPVVQRRNVIRSQMSYPLSQFGGHAAQGTWPVCVLTVLLEESQGKRTVES